MKFETAVETVLRWEGGYSNDPDDPGQETNFGISKRAFPDEDIENLTRERAIELYREHYWNRLRCDDLPEPLRLAVFDTAVHSGQIPAAKILQKKLGVIADGIIGPITLGAANAADSLDLLKEYAAMRGFLLGTLPMFPKYGRGWMRRLMDVTLTR